MFEYSEVKTVTLGGLEGNYLGTVNPNPVNGVSTLEFGLSEGKMIDIKLYDATGKALMVLANGYYNGGTHTLRIDSEKLSNGTYTIVMNIDGVILTQTMTVVK